MKKIYILLFTFFLSAGMGLNIKAQDTIRNLVISEVMWGHWNHEYYEFTNMSETDTIDLSEFQMSVSIGSFVEQLGDEVVITGDLATILEPNGTRAFGFGGMLPPGESYVVMQVEDHMGSMYNGKRHTPGHSIQLLTQAADTTFHRGDANNDQWALWPYIPEWEMWGFDSIQVASDGVTDNAKVSQNRQDFNMGLIWTPNDSTAVLVDQVFWDPNASIASVAGVYAGHVDNVLVRKFNVKEGETNWILSSGDTPSTSQWMMYPMNKSNNRMIRETEGNHGDFKLEYSSDVYTINDAAGTITVPWGTEKNDSIRPGLTLGKGMAWDYIENPSFQDSLSTVCQTGDTLVLYAFGNDVEIKKLAIIVDQPAADMNSAFPRHNINYPQPLNPDEEYTFAIVGNVPYVIEEYEGKMDSIINVPFATSVDTLMSRIDIAPNASWEILFSYDEPTSDVKTGDKLRVTSANGTARDYYIKCDEYASSNNVYLSSITWPDRPDMFLLGWNGDTIPNFTISGTSYTIKLPPNVKSVPALAVKTQDLNTRVAEKRAVSLSGGIEERTTTFTITSESDTLTSVVNILFEVLNPDPQKFIGHPFFSKIQNRLYWGGGGIEICNPSDELIDLSNYMIVQSNATNPADAIMGDWVNDSTGWLERYKKYVPGYKWQTLNNWSIQPGILEFDAAVDPFVEPKDVMVLWNLHADPPTKSSKSGWDFMESRVDVYFDTDDWNPGIYNNPWNEPISQYSTMAFMVHTGKGEDKLWMFEILNDSIKSGLKPANDPEDFEVVDVFGDVEDKWYIEETQLKPEIRVTRHPEYYRGVTTLGDGLGLNSQWYMLGRKWKGVTNEDRFGVWGTHTLAPITSHLSTVTSLKYKVSKGYKGLQTISGVSNSETVDLFISNLIKATEEQSLAVKSETDGSARGGADAVAQNDTLVVISADSSAVTKYLISVSPLDNNALLVAKPGSGLEIEVDGTMGKVTGFTVGTTLRSLVDNVIPPSTAMMNIIDNNNALVPLLQMSNDSVYVDITATYNHYFEVVAEDGSKIVYQLVADANASEAFVTSDIYNVTQDPVMNIGKVVVGTAVSTFLQNVTPAKGATIKVIKGFGDIPRFKGNLALDDKLQVTSEDESVVVYYSLGFYAQWTYFVELPAYVTSEQVTVSQDNMSIKLNDNTSVESLIGYLVPAPQASFGVFDANGVEKTTGTIEETDVVKVVSGDEINKVSYEIGFYLTSINTISDNDLVVYPNPAGNRIFVKNIAQDAEVHIYSVTGVSYVHTTGFEALSGINLEGLTTGMYFLSVKNEGVLQTIKKFIKE